MKSARCVIVVAVILAVEWVPAESQKAAAYQEQRHFSAEDAGVRHPVPIPDEVMAVLRKEYGKPAPDDLPASWFSASEIRLSGPNEKDLIVVAEGPLAGANVDVFWVFVRKSQKYSLALTVPAHDLLVKESRSNGYRDLEAVGATAETVTTVEFRFDGSQYKEYATKTEDIR